MSASIHRLYEAEGTTNSMGRLFHMEMGNIGPEIKARGKEFFASINGEAPSIFNKDWWMGKVMDWSMRNEDFKIQLFRFVDVFPYLTTGQSLSRHIEEYFSTQHQDIPSLLKWGAKGSGLGGELTSKMLAKTLRLNLENMAKQFIISENTKDALKALSKLRKNNFAFTVDILGEATVSEEEADHYQRSYLDLLGALEKDQKHWKSLGNEDSNLD